MTSMQLCVEVWPSLRPLEISKETQGFWTLFSSQNDDISTCFDVFRLVPKGFESNKASRRGLFRSWATGGEVEWTSKAPREAEA